MKSLGLITFSLAALLVTSPVVAQKAPETTPEPAAQPAPAAAPTTKKTKTKTTRTKAKAKTTAKTTSTPAPTTAPAAAPATKKARVRKPPSACKGLSETACGANKTCGWIKPKKAVSKSGRKLKAYCRLVAGVAKKKAK